MTSTIDSAGAEGQVDTRVPVPPDIDAPAPSTRAVTLRRKPVTRSVRGRRTVVVPAERLSPAELAARVPFVVVLLLIIGAGMGKGPALALLLAGPALSLPNMLVIRSVMGTKKTVVFVLLVIIMATISGLIYGALF